MNKKAIAIFMSLFALAYVSLAWADEGNGESQNDTEKTQEQGKKQWEQDREQKKKEWEQDREQKKKEWEQKREQMKTDWEQQREKWKTEKQQALEKWKKEKETLKAEFKEKFTTERCAKIEERIKNRTEWFNGSKEKHGKVYANLLSRIDKFIAKFEAFNANPANTTKIDQAKIDKLKADRDILAKMITDFKTAYADYFTKLKGTNNYTCGHSEGEFRASLVDAKTYLKTVRDNAAAIRKYVRETILPDLLAVKKEIARIKGDNDEEKGEEKKDDEKLEKVTIISPADGAAYSSSATVTISAKAEEDESVSKVEFYDGATLKGEDTTKPYSYAWTITAADAGPNLWTAKAYDNATPANSVTSPAVSLTVNIPTP